MSNDKRKALLNEETTRRFWKLAGLRPIHEKAFIFNEKEEVEEETEAVDEGDRMGREDDDKKEVDEGDRMGREDEDKMEESEEIDEMGMRADEDEPEPEMDMDSPMDDEGPEDGQDVEVDVPEGDVASLKTARDILDQILSAVSGDEGEEESPEMDMDDDPAEEELEADLNEVDQEDLEEIAERIAARVAKRIQESLIRKNK